MSSAGIRPAAVLSACRALATLTPRPALPRLIRPDHIVLTSALPKTRSGKIMRRVLRKLIAREYESIGDTSTLADPSVVEELKAKVDKLLGRER